MENLSPVDSVLQLAVGALIHQKYRDACLLMVWSDPAKVLGLSVTTQVP